MDRGRTESLSPLETAFIIEWFLYRMDPHDRQVLKEELPVIYAKLHLHKQHEVFSVDDDGIPF